VSLLSEVREALAARVAATALDGTIEVYAYPVANPQVRPAAVLFLPGDTYVVPHMDMARNTTEINLIARLFVNSADNESAMQQVDDWLTGDATRNLILALEDSYAFSGDLAGTAHVSEVSNFAAGTVELGGSDVPVMSCDLLVKIYVRSA
jgi:hypothetical protein